MFNNLVFGFGDVVLLFVGIVLGGLGLLYFVGNIGKNRIGGHPLWVLALFVGAGMVALGIGTASERGQYRAEVVETFNLAGEGQVDMWAERLSLEVEGCPYSVAFARNSAGEVVIVQNTVALTDTDYFSSGYDTYPFETSDGQIIKHTQDQCEALASQGAARLAES